MNRHSEEIGHSRPTRPGPAAAVLTLAVLTLAACRPSPPAAAPQLVRYGSLHEAVAQHHDQGRVELTGVLARPHFYGIGAVAGLQGEITVDDSTAVVTAVGADRHPEPVSPVGLQATLLAGASVAAWTDLTLDDDVPADRLDDTVAAAADGNRLDRAEPFVFLLDGRLTDLRLHVLNGACPVHARMQKITLDEAVRPFELETESLVGTVVGLYAEGAVGELTHPATSVHAHLVFDDPATGRRITAHLERFGLAAGTVLRLPAPAAR